MNLMNILYELINKKTLHRIQQNKIFEDVSVSGDILDVGGGGGASYLRAFDFTSVNSILSADYDGRFSPDFVFDAQEKWPIKNQFYDCIFLINCIYVFRDPCFVLREASMHLKQGGKLIVTFPLFFGDSPEPTDFYRLTEAGAILFAKKSGLEVLSHNRYGCIFSVCADLLRPFLLRFFLYLPVAIAAHYLDIFLIKILKKRSIYFGTVLELKKSRDEL